MCLTTRPRCGHAVPRVGVPEGGRRRRGARRRAATSVRQAAFVGGQLLAPVCGHVEVSRSVALPSLTPDAESSGSQLLCYVDCSVGAIPRERARAVQTGRVIPARAGALDAAGTTERCYHAYARLSKECGAETSGSCERLLGGSRVPSTISPGRLASFAGIECVTRYGCPQRRSADLLRASEATTQAAV